jgi:hypothetical protein
MCSGYKERCGTTLLDIASGYGVPRPNLTFFHIVYTGKRAETAHAKPVAEPQRPPGGGYGCTAWCRWYRGTAEWRGVSRHSMALFPWSEFNSDLAMSPYPMGERRGGRRAAHARRARRALSLAVLEYPIKAVEIALSTSTIHPRIHSIMNVLCLSYFETYKTIALTSSMFLKNLHTTSVCSSSSINLSVIRRAPGFL